MNLQLILLLLLLVLSVTIRYINIYYSHFVLKIFNRWLRWITFSVVFAIAFEYFTEPGARPLWMLLLTGFLLYSLIETIYYWLEVSALSYSDMALFPKFRPNTDGDEWPSHKKFIIVKDWLKDNNFNHLQSVKASLGENIHIRASIYEEKQLNLRCQVLFLPQSSKSVNMCYIFSSLSTEGNRYVTDNVFVPYGGFYPQNWYIVRKPTIHNINKLYNIHKKLLKKSAETLTNWDNSPLKDINDQQRQLESINIDSGFLYPADMHDEHGKISNDGRYRMWKEIWLMNYLGQVVKA